MHKYYYTYKITLLKGSLAGHYYYGQHSTNDLNDGYAGSGHKVIKYYNKYDKIEGVTYKKDIIAFYNNDDELNKAEAELIGDKYNTDPMCLNLKAGGIQAVLSKESRQKISATLNGNCPWNKGKINVYSKEALNKMSAAHKDKHQSEATRQKISEHNYTKLYGQNEATRQKISQGRQNRVWIHLNEKIKFVYIDYLDYWLDDGWMYGRGKQKKSNQNNG